MSSNAHKMGLVALTLVTASNMMGSGVFLLPSELGAIGYITIFGWILTIIGVMALALVFAKTSFITPRNGGIVAYATDAFGPFVGFQSTLCYWISAWMGNVALLIAALGYSQYFFPQLQNPLLKSICAIVILWSFILLSSRGANLAGKLQSFTASCMLLVVLGTGIVGWFWFNPAVYEAVLNDSGQSNTSSIFTAASMTLWGFLGVESAVVSTGQVVNPERNVPRATVFGVLIAAVCYVSSCTVIMGILSHAELANSSAPFADTVRKIFGSTAGNITSGLSIIACIGSLSGWLILQSESAKAGAEQGLFPSFFAETNSRNVPVKGLIATGLLMSCVLLMTSSSTLNEQFKILTLLAVFAGLLPYAYAVIALPIIMVAKKMDKGKDFMFYSALVIVGMVYCLFAFLGSPSDTLFWGVALMIITIPLYAFVSAKRSKSNVNVLTLGDDDIVR